MSGTSMSTPHVSGVVVLLKSVHPDWSPAAIRSAIVITAHLENKHGNIIKDEQLKQARIFFRGAGQASQPHASREPGADL
jgi:subtilisin family serine protease